MRILDQTHDTVSDNTLLLLTITEASELKDALEDILQSEELGIHSHINDLDYSHELTVALYSEDTDKIFSQRIKSL